MSWLAPSGVIGRLGNRHRPGRAGIRLPPRRGQLSEGKQAMNIFGHEDLSKPNAKRIALFSATYKKYITAGNGGEAPLNASRSTIGAEEIFVIEVNADDTISLRAGNNQYVTVENAGEHSLVARASSPGLWEKFLLVHVADSQFGLKAVANSLYLRVRDGNGKPINAEGSVVGDREKINIAWLDNDLYRAFTASAMNFPGRVKGHTKGCISPPGPPPDHGIKFIAEQIENGKLWLYWGYPESDLYTWPLGYRHVWDGIELERDGYISADCTIPKDGRGAIWAPPIPRTYRYQPIGVTVQTKTTRVQDTQIECDNTLYMSTCVPHYGVVYEARYMDLSDARSEENLGWRWVLPIGIDTNSERWFFDLGPQVGVFEPRYGTVGYGAADVKPPDPPDETFCANIQTSSILEDRRFNGSARRLVNVEMTELDAIDKSTDVPAYRWAHARGYVGGIWNHENQCAYYQVICLTAAEAELHNVPITELNAIHHDPDVAAYRWARNHNFVAGKWTHEDDTVYRWIISIYDINVIAEVHNVPIFELNALFPNDPDRAAYRWAVMHGYAAGAWTHEDDGTYMGLICFYATPD
jgi:hypothetical protein